MALKTGDKIPRFQLYDQDGELFDVNDHIGKQNLVVYFYPKDDTPGCTAEACGFRDSFEDFLNFNCEVIGISEDDIATHKNFKIKHNLPFTLLSDPDNKVRKQFGVPRSLFGILPGRVTYVANKSGTIQHVFNSQFRADKHIEEAINVLKAMKND